MFPARHSEASVAAPIFHTCHDQIATHIAMMPEHGNKIKHTTMLGATSDADPQGEQTLSGISPGASEEQTCTVGPCTKFLTGRGVPLYQLRYHLL